MLRQEFYSSTTSNASDQTYCQDIIPALDVEYINDCNDERVSCFRMKSKRDEKTYCNMCRQMKQTGDNYVCAMSTKVVENALKGVYPVIAVLGIPRLLQRMQLFIQQSNSEPKIMSTTKEVMENVIGIKLNNEHLICAIVNVPNEPVMAQQDINAPVIIFDDVRSSDNIGSIMRTAWSLGVSTVILSKVSSGGGLTSRCARVSMGGLFHLRVYISDDIVATIRQLRSLAIKVYGSCPKAKTNLAPHPNARWALLIGNEDQGASDKSLCECDILASVPQLQGNCLSVSHAMAICCYELNRNQLSGNS